MAARQAILLRPGYHWSYYQLAEVLYVLGRTDEAIDASRQSLLLKPGFFEALAQLGMIRLSRGEYLDDLTSLEQARAQSAHPEVLFRYHLQLPRPR